MNNDLRNWIPEKFVCTPGEQMVRWLYTGDQSYTDPFFDETINRCRALPYNQHPQKVLSSTSWLVEKSKEINAVTPSAFIFHVSRCGSTLVSQLLGLLPGNIVLAEVPFLDDVLRQDTDDDLLEQTFHATLAFYGQRRSGNETHLFIKTDSWHLHFLPRLRELFPATPFFILYREPGAVLRSHMKRKGMQAVPGLLDPSIFGFEKESIQAMHPGKYMEEVLAGYYRRILEYARQENTHLVCYEEGIMYIVETICRQAGVHIDAESERAMRERMKYHSKYSRQAFTGDVFDSEADIPCRLEKLYAAIRKIEMKEAEMNI